jgi:hypothetical protein
MVDRTGWAALMSTPLLDDPDPDRSLAAMQIMIGLGDPQISRMALQHSLTSTNPAVRRAALKGIFINRTWNSTTDQFRFGRVLTRIANVSGSVGLPNGNGFMTFGLL